MTLRLDSLIGREVWTADGRKLGRLEEGRAGRRGGAWVILEWVIGPAGLFERLGINARLVVGICRHHGYLARWDQLDLRDPARPRLTCAVTELERLTATTSGRPK